MANLVDDYKNMISNGVRIRSGIVTVSNGDNAITPLDLYECVICNKGGGFDETDEIRLFFTSNVTGDFFVFKIPYYDSYYGSNLYDMAMTPVNYVNVVNSSYIRLWMFETTSTVDRYLFYNYMYWLFLRIA